MSRHFFRTTLNGCPVVVSSGWDRQLGSCFLYVDYLDTPDGSGSEGRYTYSFLDDHAHIPLTPERVAELLDAIGIEPPAGMIAAIDDDRRANGGCLVIDWSQDERPEDTA